MRIASLLPLLLMVSLSAAAEPLPDGVIAQLGTRRFRHGGVVWSLAFAPDGKTLASGGGDAVVRFWDVKTGQQIRVSPAFYSHIEALSFSPDGTTLAMTDSHPYGRTYLLDAATGKTRQRMENRPPPMGNTGILAAVFAPNGKTLAATIPTGKVALYDAVTLERTAVLGKHDHYNVPRLAFSPDGLMLASSGQDATVRLWDVVKRKARFVLRSEDTAAFPIVFSRDGKWLISGGGT